MDMEKARGISISSAALQFGYGDAVVNLLDTPGHADFSEDTYRVLAAVDSAVMLLDAAKGLEPQTMKLFDVCRHRGIPVLTVVNKWDRPGLEALELMDEIRERTGLEPTPLTWPVGIAGDFRGVLDRSTGDFVRFTRTAGGATIAPRSTSRPPRPPPGGRRLAHGRRGERAARGDGPGARPGELPVRGDDARAVRLRGAELRRPAAARHAARAGAAARPSARRKGEERPLDTPFSAFVFKIQAGMDTAHRDRLAYVRVCSGVFERGTVVTHAATGKPFATKYAQQVFGRDRETVDLAYPGDVVGLGQRLRAARRRQPLRRRAVVFPPIPSFAPEHFAVCRAVDSSRYKQFRRGIEQLEQEGTVQVLRSELRGDQAPVLAAVGPMQFEVAEHRMAGEFSAPVRLDRLEYTMARLTDRRWGEVLDRESGVEVLERSSDGALLALFAGNWRLQRVLRDHPDAVLEPLVAASS
jgi:peptide chain release factor 3